jgi:hypothetical protein
VDQHAILSVRPDRRHMKSPPTLWSSLFGAKGFALGEVRC